jgi:hypothetical protein
VAQDLLSHWKGRRDAPSSLGHGSICIAAANERQTFLIFNSVESICKTQMFDLT